MDYYLHEPDFDDHTPLESYHSEINELQLQQLNGWLLQIRVPLRHKDLYKSTFQRLSETRKNDDLLSLIKIKNEILGNWQECYVRIVFDEKKLRFYLPTRLEQIFAEIELQTWYQCTKLSLQQYDQYTKIHTFKIVEANYHEIPQVRFDRLVTLPEKLLRKFTRPNKAQQILLDHADCIEQEIVKFGQLNYRYLKQFSIILDDLFWSMPITRSRLQKHIKEEVTVKILDEYDAHIDQNRHICQHKSRTRLFILAFLNGYTPRVEIGINNWFRHGKEINKRNEIIINKTLQEYWIKPEQVELSSIIDKNEYENTRLLKFIPPDSQKIEIMRFRTRPKQNIELPLQVMEKRRRKEMILFLQFRFIVLCRLLNVKLIFELKLLYQMHLIEVYYQRHHRWQPMIKRQIYVMMIVMISVHVKIYKYVFQYPIHGFICFELRNVFVMELYIVFDVKREKSK